MEETAFKRCVCGVMGFLLAMLVQKCKYSNDKQANFPGYITLFLDQEARSKYLEKVGIIGGLDPYETA